MANATMVKFGYPGSLVAEYRHWAVLLRPAQVTLGALVLAAKSDATAYSKLPPEAFAEQREVVVAIERALAVFTGFKRINYLMLMMVDPHVHFHVVPRYSGPREFGGTAFPDAGWPGPPDLKASPALSDETLEAIRSALAAHF